MPLDNNNLAWKYRFVVLLVINDFFLQSKFYLLEIYYVGQTFADSVFKEFTNMAPLGSPSLGGRA